MYRRKRHISNKLWTLIVSFLETYLNISLLDDVLIPQLEAEQAPSLDKSENAALKFV
jgi:hypothetical protein